MHPMVVLPSARRQDRKKNGTHNGFQSILVMTKTIRYNNFLCSRLCALTPFWPKKITSCPNHVETIRRA